MFLKKERAKERSFETARWGGGERRKRKPSGRLANQTFELHAVDGKKMTLFIEKCNRSVIFLLSSDEAFDDLDHRITHRDCCIRFLPGELGLDEIVTVDPMGGFALDVLQDIFHRIIRVEEK